jgi:tight adherence protein C
MTSSPLFFICISIMVFSAMGLLGSVMLTRSSRAASERMFQVTLGVSAKTQPRPSRSNEVQKNLFAAVHWVRSRLGMTENAKLLERFAHAGLKSSGARDTYFAAKLLGPVAAILIGSFIPSSRAFAMAALGGIFYLLPDIILNRLIKRRREKIRRGIPDAIDLLVICVDAGLGMDQAMLRVGQELGTSHPQIYEEFMQINREQRAGKLRLDAWQAMAERSKLPEIDGFVNMLMQTERFGTPIARALSTYGDGIRLKRRQRAEELAAKTTVKIIFPLVLFIFPSMFIVLLGPAGINIAKGMAGATQ